MVKKQTFTQENNSVFFPEKLWERIFNFIKDNNIKDNDVINIYDNTIKHDGEGYHSITIIYKEKDKYVQDKKF